MKKWKIGLTALGAAITGAFAAKKVHDLKHPDHPSKAKVVSVVKKKASKKKPAKKTVKKKLVKKKTSKKKASKKKSVKGKVVGKTPKRKR